MRGAGHKISFDGAEKKQTNQLGFAQLQNCICNDPSGEKN
jgi:hypothetical protein